MKQLKLELVIGSPTFQIVVQSGKSLMPVLRVKARFPFLKSILQLMILISELIFPFGREIDLVGLQIPAPEANIPGVQSQIKILLSFLERFFRA